MPEKPKVSYVLSVRDGERDIVRCAKSVLNQSVSDVELVAVDDHSEDGTWAVMMEIASADNRFRGIKNQGQSGLTYALNIGIDFARGEYIARIDVDDFAHRNRTARQVELLESRPDAPMCATAYRVVDPDDWEVYCHCPSTDPALLRWSLCFRNNIRHSTAMWRRSLDLRYEPSFPCSQDYEMWCRTARLGDILVEPDVLTTVRSRPNSITSTRHEEQETMADRVAAGQYEFYTGASIDPRQARNLRMVHHLKNAEQFKVFDEIPPREFEKAVERYCRLADAFARKESPEPVSFLAEIGNDIRPIMNDQKRAREASKTILKIARLMGVSSVASQIEKRFARATAKAS